MTKTDIFNSDYTTLNHCYIEIYNTYKKLTEAEDIKPDDEVLDVLGKILIVFNPVLDKIKSEMTVKTRFKDSSENTKPGKFNPSEKNDDSAENGQKKTKGKSPIILHGNFTGE